ncbi:hypothetical protein [Oligoflexus tunisiensis]|uniref:hypothetical protein n=1 Tax=Oligoflexus tunisiensis TaxID=708132 RepID=UPI00114C9042|nr:hypothetical protein [Oligoflexus tunisiensis]
MKSVRLVVREETFCVGPSSKSSFTGELYFDVDGWFFPSKSWNDLIPGVLHMWTDNLIAILRGGSESHQLNFMDGPYKILIAMEGKSLKLTFMEEKYDTDTDAEFNVELRKVEILTSDFIEQICNAVRVTIEFAKKKGILYSSIPPLEKNLKILAEYCAK